MVQKDTWGQRKKGREFTISKIENFEIAKIAKTFYSFLRFEWYVEIR